MEVIIYGLLIGVFVSLIGGGGASLYLGVLTSQIGLPTSTAVPTSLFIAVPALFFGFLTQLKIKNVHLKIGNQMIVAAIPGIFIGTILAKYIPLTIYNWLVGILLLVMGILVLLKYFRPRKKITNSNYSSSGAIYFGLLSGLMVGIGGLSGGATTMSGLTLMGLPTFLAAGTTTYVLWVMALLGFITHLFTSTVDWHAGLLLMFGAIIGSVITPLFMNKIDSEKFNKYLTPVLGIVIIYFGLNMLI